MEQFRQVGEVLGSIKALMVLQDEIPINKRQCRLLLDIFSLAFTLIATSIKQNLKLEEKNTTKWKALDHPLRELHRVFREAEVYIKHCMDSRDWWAKAVIFHQNRDSVEFHIHNLLCNFPAVVEAIEIAGEISGLDPEEIQKKGFLLRKKYDRELNDPKVFSLRFGEQYLVTKELRMQIESAWREDRWLLSEAIKERIKAEPMNGNRLGECMLKKINETSAESAGTMLFPSSVLIGSTDFQVRRRLGNGAKFKEIRWLGESFALRHVITEIEPLKPKIRTLLLLSHSNIIQYLYGFCNEERNEYFLVMELMSKDLWTHIRETSSPRRCPPPIPVIVDIMLQIARGMEYLHSNGIFHGDLNPMNVYLKSRSSLEGFFHVKVSGFGLSSVNDKNSCNSPRSPETTNKGNPFIWYAPEVIVEQVKQGSTSASLSKIKYSEKADVYGFAMTCFDLLTGKVPFEEWLLQGDKITRNIVAGERPLFPYSAPKYLAGLIKKCWATDTASRPSFSSICRILRYIKKFLVMNPELDNQPQLRIPSVDFCDIENEYQKKFLATEDTGNLGIIAVWDIPFQMFSYRIAEIGRTRSSPNLSEFTSDAGSMCKSELQPPIPIDMRSTFSDFLDKRPSATKRAALLAHRNNLRKDRRLRDIIEDQQSPIPIDLRSTLSDFVDKRSPAMKRAAFLASKTNLGRDCRSRDVIHNKKQSTLVTDSFDRKSSAMKAAMVLAQKKNLMGDRRPRDVRSVCALEDHRPSDVRSVCTLADRRQRDASWVSTLREHRPRDVQSVCALEDRQPSDVRSVCTLGVPRLRDIKSVGTFGDQRQRAVKPVSTGDRRPKDVKSVNALEDRRPTDVKSVCSKIAEKSSVPSRKLNAFSSRKASPSAPMKQPEKRASRLNPTQTPGIRKSRSNVLLMSGLAEKNRTKIHEHVSDSEVS